MIKYDWNVLSKEQVSIVLSFFISYKEHKLLLDIPSLRLYKRFKDKSSFLLNPLRLVNNANKHAISDIKMYLHLASMRSYFEYKQTGNLRLPTIYIEGEINVEKLKSNKLLDVTNTEIIFRYEE